VLKVRNLIFICLLVVQGVSSSHAEFGGDAAAFKSLQPEIDQVNVVRQQVQVLRGSDEKVSTRYACQGRVTVSVWRQNIGPLRLVQRRSSLVGTVQAESVWATYDSAGALRYVRWAVRERSGQFGEAEIYFTSEGGRKAVPFLTRLRGQFQRLNNTSVPVQLAWLKTTTDAVQRSLGCQDSSGRLL
jgi:hypothetical protein